MSEGSSEKKSEVDRMEKAFAFMLYFGTVVSGIIAVSVVVVPVIATIWGNYAMPGYLKDWAALIVGFYFGSLISTVGTAYKQTH